MTRLPASGWVTGMETLRQRLACRIAYGRERKGREGIGGKRKEKEGKKKGIRIKQREKMD